MPDELSDNAKKHWAKIRPLLVEVGIAINTDRVSLMMLCENYADWLEAQAGLRKTGILIRGANGHPVKSPYFEAVNQTHHRLLQCLVEFGMTPSARSKVISAGRKPSKKGAAFDL